jgi:hypothetical protein
MNPKPLRYVLIFLLFSASFDDEWALSTPDLSDDALAAEDNEYQYASSPCRHKRSREGSLPAPGKPTEEPAPGSVPAPISTAPNEPQSQALEFPSLLYLLMSLQR